jgi:hypothetical protein
MAFAPAGISLNCKNISSSRLLLMRHPGGRAARPVAGDFSNRSVSIEEANAA